MYMAVYMCMCVDMCVHRVQVCAHMGAHACRGQNTTLGVILRNATHMSFKKTSLAGSELIGWPWNPRIPLVPDASSEECLILDYYQL